MVKYYTQTLVASNCVKVHPAMQFNYQLSFYSNNITTQLILYIKFSINLNEI